MNITLCTDLDRTLLPNGLQKSDPQAIPVLSKLIKQKDITLVYVTGRDKKLVEQAIEEYQLPIPDHTITDVGTQIYRISANSTSEKYSWDSDDNYRQYLQKDWDSSKLKLIMPQLAVVPNLRLQEPEKQSQFKLSYYIDNQADATLLDQKVKKICITNGLACNIISSHDETTDIGLLDILPAVASKYHAIRFLMDKYRIVSKEIIFCGDSGNDMEVAVSEIPSVLVNNTQHAVKQHALQLVEQNHHAEQLYIAKGDFYGLNGCYCSGILEGLAYYYAEFEKIIAEQMAEYLNHQAERSRS